MHPPTTAKAIKLILLTACQVNQPTKLSRLKNETETFISYHAVSPPSAIAGPQPAGMTAIII